MPPHIQNIRVVGEILVNTEGSMKIIIWMQEYIECCVSALVSEEYDGISGHNVADLLTQRSFPDKPTKVTSLSSFSITGAYTWYISLNPLPFFRDFFLAIPEKAHNWRSARDASVLFALCTSGCTHKNEQTERNFAVSFFYSIFFHSFKETQ